VAEAQHDGAEQRVPGKQQAGTDFDVVGLLKDGRQHSGTDSARFDVLASTQPGEANAAKEQTILNALNGTGEHPVLMNVPPDVRQLAVVTSGGWDKNHGEMRIFERGGADQPWHRTDFGIPVTLGEKGMGWGVGGLIPGQPGPRTIEGNTESVAGPLLSSDPRSPSFSSGDAKCDSSGNAKCEGDRKTTAGLFRVGLAWGTADARAWKNNDAPVGTSLPYLKIDADYRVMPTEGPSLKDEQGNQLNGAIIRQINADTRTYERYENGAFVQGTLSAEALAQVENATQDPSTHYRWVHKDLSDKNGTSLTDKLVQIDAAAYTNDQSKSYFVREDGQQLSFKDGSYVAIDPADPERKKIGGELSAKTAKEIFNDSDYKFGDDADRGHKMLVDERGKPIFDDQHHPLYSAEVNDDLYNHPLRIVNAQTGEYEHLDPATGKSLGLGRMDPQAMKKLIEEDEDMNDLYYRNAVNILQNTGQIRKGGADIFIHQAGLLRPQQPGDQPKIDDTYGCVAMTHDHLREFIRRLDVTKNPSILISPMHELDTVRAALS
jgi:hypothetical protein